jgi:hypothetical protein
VRDATPTDAPSAKEATGEATTAGNEAPEAPHATPATSVASAVGASLVAMAPPSPRAPSPIALAGEKETKGALSGETPATGETPTGQEVPTARGAPIEDEMPPAGEMDIHKEAEASAEKRLVEGEEEASAVQDKAQVVSSPGATIMGDEGARASPLRPGATPPPAVSSGGGAEGGSAPSSS